jgi:Sulfotransferase domain
LAEVVYVAGYSRSGSTLLDLLLGQLPGFFSTGELGYIWTHGLQQNRVCGCGDRFLDCSFWSRVGEDAFGGWENVDAAQMRRLELQVNRHRFVPLLAVPHMWPAFDERAAKYAWIISKVYTAIERVSGAQFVVDSTIDPAYGFLLRGLRNHGLNVLHMVRDSRATAFSWTRLQRRTDRVDAIEFQRRFPPLVTGGRWLAYHALVHFLDRLGPGQLMIRYEDLVTTPADQLRKVTAFLGKDVAATDLAFLDGDHAIMKPNHTIAGSLVRLRRGAIEITPDDEWKTALSRGNRRAVTLATWPLLRKYGYIAPNGKSGASKGMGLSRS